MAYNPIVIGNGTSATAQRVTVSNDSTGVLATVGAVTAITNALPVGANVIGKVSIDQTTPGTTNKVDIADSLNNPVSAFPATFLRVTDEPRQVFYDPFDSTLDVTNRWTSTQGNSGVAASTTTGVMSLGTGTTANGYSKLTSQASFTLPIPAWMGISDAIAIPDLAAPTANSFRFWGNGTTPGTPSTTTPVTEGVGFELSTAGKMFAVVYAGGTRTAIQDLSAATGNSTQPTDANNHRYIVYVRTDKAYWYIDGLTSAQLVATSNFQSPQVQTLPRLFLAVGGPTPPVSNSQITCTGATAWDTGKNVTQLSDGTFPWRKATISSTGSLSVALAANQSVNVAQLAGTTTSVNNGTTDAGTLRVTLSSDSTGQVKLAAGAAVIGHVISDTGSTTAVTQATAANLNAAVVGVGTAGTPSGGVLTIQGVTSMTKLLVTPDSVALPANQSVNVSQINAVTPLMGNGVTGTGSQRVTIASDGTAISTAGYMSVKIDQTTPGTTNLVAVSSISTSVTPGTAAANLGKAEDAAHVSGDTGVMALAVRSDTIASTAGTTGDYQPPITNNVGALWVAGAASNNGGWSVATGTTGSTKVDIGTANTAGQVSGWYFYNSNATVSYVQFFNTQASGVTLGTTPPVYSLGIPATSAANIAPGMVGIAHTTAISIAITTTRSGSTGPGSTVDYNVWYKQ